MSHWASSFYDLQDRLTGGYSAPIHPFHHQLAARLTLHLGKPGSLLELGAGGGQFAVAATLAGQSVTALELRAAGSAHTRRLAAEHGVKVGTLSGDFYQLDPGGPYSAVCYWDGFGIGTDDDQRQLLRRLPGWLATGGAAYIDVFTPWYWARRAGQVRRWDTPAGLVQTYGFDADGCRMTDTYAPATEPAQTQSLRCYSPADLRLLLAGTGLRLAEIWPGGSYDVAAEVWHPQVPLGECMTYVAVLRPERA